MVLGILPEPGMHILIQVCSVLAGRHNKMLSYRRETALQGALQFSPKVED